MCVYVSVCVCVYVWVLQWKGWGKLPRSLHQCKDVTILMQSWKLLLFMMQRRLSQESGVCTNRIFSIVPTPEADQQGTFTMAMWCSSLPSHELGSLMQTNCLALAHVSLSTLFLDIFQRPSHTSALWYRYCCHHLTLLYILIVTQILSEYGADERFH